MLLMLLLFLAPLLARVDAGLLSLQQLCLSLAALFQAADGPLRTRLIKLLHQNKLPLQAVRVTLAEVRGKGGRGNSGVCVGRAMG